MCSSECFCSSAGRQHGYVKPGSMTVYSKPTVNSKSVGVVYNGEIVTVLEAYSNGKSRSDNYHKIQMSDGTVGYVYAFGNGETLEDTAEADKRQQDLPMTNTSTILICHFCPIIYTAAQNRPKVRNMSYIRTFRASGARINGRNLCRLLDAPLSMSVMRAKSQMLKLILHPGTSSVNYHERRLKRIKKIGYDPVFNKQKCRKFQYSCVRRPVNLKWLRTMNSGLQSGQREQSI